MPPQIKQAKAVTDLSAAFDKSFTYTPGRGWSVSKIKDALVIAGKITGNMKPKAIKNTAQGDKYVFDDDITIVKLKSGKNIVVIKGLSARNEDIKLKTYKTFVNEGKNDYTLYHDTLTSAIKEVDQWLLRNGKYTMDDEDAATEIGNGPAKPSKGKTNRYNVKLLKGDKEQKKKVHIQVYNRGTETNPFELNVYVS